MNIRILVCGAGSIGTRHIRNIRLLGHEVLVWRFNERIMAEFEKDTDVIFCSHIEEAMDDSDAVVIATSTDSHIEIASLAVQKGKHFYIEKPISHNLDFVETIRKQILEKKIIVEVGCQLRFHPGLRALKSCLDKDNTGSLYTFHAAVGQRLDLWRPGTDYKKCYSANRKRGGGALFDLIHEVDLVLWLLGQAKEVFAEQTKVSDLEMEADDLTNLTLVMRNGAVGQVQMDMVSPVYRRHLELVFQKVIYRWDYVSGRLTRLADGKEDLLYMNKPEFERNCMFFDHMNHFARQVEAGVREPACSFEEGIAALKIVVAAKRSAETNTKISVL